MLPTLHPALRCYMHALRTELLRACGVRNAAGTYLYLIAAARTAAEGPLRWATKVGRTVEVAHRPINSASGGIQVYDRRNENTDA